MTLPPVYVICVASWNADLVSRVVRPLARGETVLAHAFDIGPGGKGSNAAGACARQGAFTASQRLRFPPLGSSMPLLFSQAR